jgi:hypothetical protein
MDEPPRFTRLNVRIKIILLIIANLLMRLLPLPTCDLRSFCMVVRLIVLLFINLTPLYRIALPMRRG